MKRGNIEWLRREKRSAVLGMALFGLLQMACVIGFAALSAIPNIPRWLFILFTVLAAVCAAVLLPALWTLRKRFQELDTAKEFVSLYKEERHMLLVNIDYIPGRELEVLGIAKGTVVQSKNFGKDFMAGIIKVVLGLIGKITVQQNHHLLKKVRPTVSSVWWTRRSPWGRTRSSTCVTAHPQSCRGRPRSSPTVPR